jgi:hypothetical protein
MRPNNNSRDGQKQADFGGQAQITHPAEGLDHEQMSEGIAKLHFQTFPRPAKNRPAHRTQVQTLDLGSESPDYTLDTDADLFPSARSVCTTRSTSIARSPAAAWAIPASAEPAEAFCAKAPDANRNDEYVQTDWVEHALPC